MGLDIRTICILCNKKELFLALKRSLHIFIPKAKCYFYNTTQLCWKRICDIQTLSHNNSGTIIAFFLGSDDQLTCRIIKYLRIRKKLKYSLVYCSLTNNHKMIAQYPVLTYGASSHKYCSLPINMDVLVDIILLSSPMSDGNHALFCREYSEKHKELYDSIMPLLKKIISKDGRNECIIELEKLIGHLINNTPVTCHKIIMFHKVNNSLLDHLRNEVVALRNQADNNNINLSGIIFLLKYWLNHVTMDIYE
jgi:hypothetical protein